MGSAIATLNRQPPSARVATCSASSISRVFSPSMVKKGVEVKSSRVRPSSISGQSVPASGHSCSSAWRASVTRHGTAGSSLLATSSSIWAKKARSSAFSGWRTKRATTQSPSAMVSSSRLFFIRALIIFLIDGWSGTTDRRPSRFCTRETNRSSPASISFSGSTDFLSPFSWITASTRSP